MCQRIHLFDKNGRKHEYTTKSLQTRKSFCGTWYLPHSQFHNERTISGRMHCACTKRPYLHFQTKIWRHRRVPRPRFQNGRENLGDSRTFKAYIGLLNICMGFPDLSAWNGFFLGGGGKTGEGVVRYWSLTNSFFLLRVLTSVPILVKTDQEMRPWECSQTDTHTDRLTDANRFYSLSHVICYS